MCLIRPGCLTARNSATTLAALRLTCCNCGGRVSEPDPRLGYFAQVCQKCRPRDKK